MLVNPDLGNPSDRKQEQEGKKMGDENGQAKRERDEKKEKKPPP
jgi:hypothetical protein